MAAKKKLATISKRGGQDKGMVQRLKDQRSVYRKAQAILNGTGENALA